MDANTLTNDIYFQDEYAKLYLNEDDRIYRFEYTKGEQWFRSLSIMRPIPNYLYPNYSETLFDLETPYGYGGPITNSQDIDFINEAMQLYRADCVAKNIVCEFIRFHPHNQLAAHANLFDFHLQERRVVSVNLRTEQHERWQGYSKTTRNIIRKCEKKLTFDENIHLDEFINIYQQTMDKNNADRFFYFPKKYFEKLHTHKNCQLLGIRAFDGELLSAGFFFLSGPLAHYHLSANNLERQHENGNYYLLEQAFVLAKAAGCKSMLLGGGRTSSENDSLFQFKAKFSKDILPFYIAGLDFNSVQRKQLNDSWQVNHSDTKIQRFQKYRMSPKDI
ncbi:hypothetical protein [Shewanella mangrovisoli]|uniref:BioF2-like acetyltransferase domain-containing protein n=1 Tax=Shewanella mangrovisoli TaxID=2864211 RepID=A0ABV4VG68_9GAMM